MSISIRLTPDIEQRLAHLADATGRSKSFYLRKLIEDNLDDLEDVYLAERVLERLRSGEERTYTFDEVERDLDLAD